MSLERYEPQETAELTELIRRIKDEFKITIMLIEHDMNLVMEVTERFYLYPRVRSFDCSWDTR